jgi:hypothetical protein
MSDNKIEELNDCPLCCESKNIFKSCVNDDCKYFVCLSCLEKLRDMTVNSTGQMDLDFDYIVPIINGCPVCRKPLVSQYPDNSSVISTNDNFNSRDSRFNERKLDLEQNYDRDVRERSQESIFNAFSSISDYIINSPDFDTVNLASIFIPSVSSDSHSHRNGRGRGRGRGRGSGRGSGRGQDRSNGRYVSTPSADTNNILNARSAAAARSRYYYYQRTCERYQYQSN